MTDAAPFSSYLWRQRQAIARNVRRMRQEIGVTQVQFAEFTKLHPGTVLRVENPEMDSITLLTLARIAWALGIPIEELLKEGESG